MHEDFIQLCAILHILYNYFTITIIFLIGKTSVMTLHIRILMQFLNKILSKQCLRKITSLYWSIL